MQLLKQVLLGLSLAFNIASLSSYNKLLSYNYVTATIEKGFAQVELSVLAPSGNDAVGEDMKNFADQLRPLVNLN